MSEYSEKLKDPRWQKVRLKVFERDKFTCLCCLRTSETLHVHHLVYCNGEPWDSRLEALETLCWECHEWREAFNDLCGKRSFAPTSFCYSMAMFAKLAFRQPPKNQSSLGEAFAGYWSRFLAEGLPGAEGEYRAATMQEKGTQ